MGEGCDTFDKLNNESFGWNALRQLRAAGSRHASSDMEHSWAAVAAAAVAASGQSMIPSASEDLPARNFATALIKFDVMHQYSFWSNDNNPPRELRLSKEH